MIKPHKICISLCILFLVLLPVSAKKPPFIGGSLALSHVKGDAGEYFVDQGLMFTKEMDGWSNTMPRSINRNTMEPLRQGIDHLGLKFKNGTVSDVIVFETKFSQKKAAETLNEVVGQGTSKWMNSRIREQAIDNIDFCSGKLRSGECIIDGYKAFPDYQIDWKVYIDSDSYYYKPLGSSELHFYDGSGKYNSIDSISGQSSRTMKNLYEISNGMYDYRKYLIQYTIEDGRVIENKFRMHDSAGNSNQVNLELKGRKDITNSKALDNVFSSNRYESHIMKRYNLEDKSVLNQLDQMAKVDLLNGKVSSGTVKTLLSSSDNTKIFNDVLNLNIKGALSDIKFTDIELDAIGKFLSTGNKEMLDVGGASGLMNKLKNADINSRLGVNINTDFAAIGFSQSEILKLNGLNGSNFDEVITPAMAKKIYSTPENKQLLKDAYAKQARKKKSVSSADIDADINNFSKKIDDMTLSSSDYQYLAKSSSQHAENMFADYTKKAMYGTIKSSMIAAGGAFAVDTIYQGFKKGWTEIDWRESFSASVTFGAVMGANALGNYTGDLLQNGLLKSSNVALNKMGKFAPFGIGVAVDTLIDGAFLFSSAYRGDISYSQAAASLAINIPFNALSWAGATWVSAKVGAAIGTPLGGFVGTVVGGAVGVIISGTAILFIVPVQDHIEIKNLYGQLSGDNNISIVLGWTDEYIKENSLF